MIIRSIAGQNNKINDDINAFEKLYKEYFTPLFLYARKIVKDDDVAEEICQDFFFYYWENRKKIKIKTSVKSYLYQSVRNRALKQIRHAEVQNRFIIRSNEQNRNNSYSKQDSELEAKELEIIIDKILNELPEKSRIIFQMNRFEGKKYREIAKELDISEKTVEAHMGKVLKIFRNKLLSYYGMKQTNL